MNIFNLLLKQFSYGMIATTTDNNLYPLVRSLIFKTLKYLGDR
ncbi:MAG: hypothetical protein V7K97_24100 [Nostoc sp.]